MAPVTFLTLYYLYTHVMLILILLVVFSFEKCLNSQNHSRILSLPFDIHSHYNCEQVVLSNKNS